MYTAGLALMVTTKENAFFVFAAILAILAANRWWRFGTASRALLALTFAGPVIGVAILTNVAGGFGTLVEVYRLGVPKNLHLEYAIATGDGPWFRYLLDLLTISPVVFVLATGMILRLRPGRPAHRPLWFLVVFVAASYVLMANVKYGMNLRYASIWDLPLRALAAAQLALLAARAGARWRWAVMTAAGVRAVRVRLGSVLPAGGKISPLRTGAAGSAARAEHHQMSKRKGRGIAASPSMVDRLRTNRRTYAFVTNRRRARKPRQSRPAPAARRLEGSGTALGTGLYVVELKFSISRL